MAQEKKIKVSIYHKYLLHVLFIFIILQIFWLVFTSLKATMYLMYYLDSNGNRVYTLNVSIYFLTLIKFHVLLFLFFYRKLTLRENQQLQRILVRWIIDKNISTFNYVLKFYYTQTNFRSILLFLIKDFSIYSSVFPRG